MWYAPGDMLLKRTVKRSVSIGPGIILTEKKALEMLCWMGKF